LVTDILGKRSKELFSFKEQKKSLKLIIIGGEKKRGKFRTHKIWEDRYQEGGKFGEDM